jgi:Tfp pilus assembly protein PilF
MSTNAEAQKLFQEGMAEFVGRNYGTSIDALSKSLELDPDFVLARLSRGAAYLRMGDNAEAQADFDRVIAMDPGHARAYHLRGLVLEKNGDDRGALDDFNRAVDLDPQYGAAYYSRATLHTKMGREDLAVEDMQMVTHLTDVNIETFANENNVWRSHQMRLEEMDTADPMDR